MIVASEDQGVWPPPSADSISNNDEIQDQKTITDAIDAFLSELVSERGRNVSKPTAGKYETLLRRLKVFCVDRGLRVTPEIKPADLQIFKDTWPTGSRATKNNIQRLRSFFRFCCGQTWLMENPAQKLEMPKNIKSTQKLPYTDEEMSRILRSALSIRLHKQQAVDNHDLYAFILAMRYTGLRISDAGLLTVDRIHDNALFLYAMKNGAHVYCPLLPWVAAVLKKVPLKQGKYLFCTGSTRLETVVELWSKRLRHVFRMAGIENGTSHRFRHTFAVDLLTNGTDIKNVSVLLGHESVLTTEEHYSAWVQSRQEALTADVMRAYASRRGGDIQAVQA